MPDPLYQAVVPVFLRFLQRLSGLVDIAEAHANTRGLSPHQILGARLAPDMLPFEAQVQIAANFALRACLPLVGQAMPPYGEFPVTFEGLRARIDRSVGIVSGLAPEHFASAQSRVVQDTAGQAVVCLPATDFLHQYAMPNFFFHLTAAYAILRAQGASVGKEHFDGFHAYPALPQEPKVLAPDEGPWQ
jgi:hypothetical protein